MVFYFIRAMSAKAHQFLFNVYGAKLKSLLHLLLFVRGERANGWATMSGRKCCLCGNNRSKDPGVSFHRFPKQPERSALWLVVFELSESDIRDESTRVCSRHFPNGDIVLNHLASL